MIYRIGQWCVVLFPYPGITYKHGPRYSDKAILTLIFFFDVMDMRRVLVSFFACPFEPVGERKRRTNDWNKGQGTRDARTSSP